jgi:hypothetical protein
MSHSSTDHHGQQLLMVVWHVPAREDGPVLQVLHEAVRIDRGDPGLGLLLQPLHHPCPHCSCPATTLRPTPSLDPATFPPLLLTVPAILLPA